MALDREIQSYARAIQALPKPAAAGVRQSTRQP
jgi:hypothetical protein